MTTIPTHKLPKKLEVGNEVPDLATFPAIDGTQDNSELRKGQVLWLRGIARLQTQVFIWFCFYVSAQINFLYFYQLKYLYYIFNYYYYLCYHKLKIKIIAFLFYHIKSQSKYYILILF